MLKRKEGNMRERYLALLEELRDFHTTFTKEDELILRARFLRVIQDYYNVDESYDTPEDDDLFDEMVDNSDYKRVERVGEALDWKYRDRANTISHQEVLTTMMYCFESCIKSHKSSGVVEAYVSTGGVTIKTNSILHSIEVSFDVFQYTVNDEDDTFAEPEPDESTRSNPFTPYTKVSTVSTPSADTSLYGLSGYAIDPIDSGLSVRDNAVSAPTNLSVPESRSYEIDTDYPTKDKSEEDKGSGIDYYQDYYKGDPYAINTDYPTVDKCEDPDSYPENYYPDSPR